ncbi:MAG: hypothetical protein ACEPOZ_07525 [Marinifilaceae bacterium]
MKYRFLSIALIVILSVGCKNTKTNRTYTKVAADSLVAKIEQYCNTPVQTEGLVVHICGVSGKKMKLQSKSGAIIKIVPADSLSRFDRTYNKKRVRVQGVVKEFRTEKKYVDRIEKGGPLLCHIDHTPCKDIEWVKEKEESGVAEKILKRDIAKLRKQMQQTGKDYVSVVTIFAEKVEIIEPL